MEKENRLNRLLELLDEKTKDGKNPADRALWHLLLQWKDKLPKLDYYFHKAFRQLDVTSDGHTDMAIWCLLHRSELFWECLTIARKRKQFEKLECQKAGKEKTNKEKESCH
jgi:hypothetical protein